MLNKQYTFGHTVEYYATIKRNEIMDGLRDY